MSSTIRAFAPDVIKAAENNAALTTIAAECHRAKWQFGLTDEDRLTAKESRALIVAAFNELHRIGDMAMKLREASTLPPSERAKTS